MTEISQTDAKKPRLVGINHIALEVSDIDQALDFYGKIFDFTLRAKRPGNAFIELGNNRAVARDARKKLGRAYRLRGQFSRPQIHIWVFEKGARR